MRNRMYGGVRGRKTKVGEKLLRFPPTRFYGGLTNIYPKMLFVNKMFGNINKILYLCTQI